MDNNINNSNPEVNNSTINNGANIAPNTPSEPPKEINTTTNQTITTNNEQVATQPNLEANVSDQPKDNNGVVNQTSNTNPVSNEVSPSITPTNSTPTPDLTNQVQNNGVTQATVSQPITSNVEAPSPSTNAPLNGVNYMPKVYPAPTTNPTNPNPGAPTNVENKPVENNVAPPSTPSPSQETPASTNNDQTIGKIKKDKKSIAPVILIFVVIIGACVALPYIYDAVSPYFSKKNPTPVPSGPSTPTNPTNPDNQEEPEQPEQPEEPSSDIVEILPETTIEFDGITFSSLELISEDGLYYISYNLTNNGEEVYVPEKDIYLELYNDENTFLGRTKINKLNSIMTGSNLTLRSEIKEEVFNNAKKVGIVSKTEAEYPIVTLNENNTLVCRKGMNIITYTFVDKKLSIFNDVYNYAIPKTEEELYASNSLIYRNKLNSYINYGALTSFVENETENEKIFIASLTLNLTDSLTAEDNKALKSMNENYYDKGTTPEIIKFEQESKAFTCE